MITSFVSSLSCRSSWLHQFYHHHHHALYHHLISSFTSSLTSRLSSFASSMIHIIIIIVIKITSIMIIIIYMIIIYMVIIYMIIIYITIYITKSKEISKATSGRKEANARLLLLLHCLYCSDEALCCWDLSSRLRPPTQQIPTAATATTAASGEERGAGIRGWGREICVRFVHFICG